MLQVHTYGTVEAGDGRVKSRRSSTKSTIFAVVAIAAIAAVVGIVAVAMSGAGSNSGSQTVEMVGTSVYGVSSRVTTMLAEKDELSEEDITFLRHYDQCQSCLVTCDHFEVGAKKMNKTPRSGIRRPSHVSFARHAAFPRLFDQSNSLISPTTHIAP